MSKLKKLPFSPFLIWVKKRIQRNRNAIIIINGPTGSGKTYSAISMAEMIAKELNSNFSVETNLDFSFSGLIKKMELPENQKPGTCFIFEEVGAVGGGAASRDWQSQENKLFFSWLQTSRHQNQIFIMTCPCFDNLEAGARKLTHWQMNTNGIDYVHKIAFLRPYRVQVNSRTGRFYFKYLRFKYQGRSFKLSRIEMPYIGEILANAYEKMKMQFSEQLKQKILKNNEEKKPERTHIDPIRLKELIDEGLPQKMIARKLGVNVRTIQRHKSKLFG